MSTGFGSTEILQVADAVAREKNIQKDSVLSAMENSIAIAARKKYGHDHDIHAEIDRKTGEIKLFRQIEVIDDAGKIVDAEDDSTGDTVQVVLEADGVRRISLSEARRKDDNLNIGDHIIEMLPPIDMGRVAAQTAKQVIIQNIRNAERERQYNDFKDRVGEIVNGVVKRLEFGDVVVELGNAEAIIKRDSVIRGENLRVGDRIRSYVEDVRREQKGPQIFLSRTSPRFMAKLFAQEVPEIYDGIIQIKAVAREPGSRAKIAVFASDSGIDPVGSCVGVRGSRVQAVITELQGEKIDIIQWSSDPATLIINALAPAEVSKVIIDEDKNSVEVVVPEDQLSLAIGRRGQNVRLAAELSGWKIDVMTDDEESTRRSDEFKRLTALFMESLNIEEIIAQLLVSENFRSIEEIAFVEQKDLESIEGFDEEIAAELQQRAREYLEQRKNDVKNQIEKAGIKSDLAEFKGLSTENKLALAKKGIKSLDDFADLSREEFVELLPESGIKNADIDSLIMKARERWFLDEVSETKAAEPEKVKDASRAKKKNDKN